MFGCTLTPAFHKLARVLALLRLFHAFRVAFLQRLLAAIQACVHEVAVVFGLRFARHKAHDVVVNLGGGATRVEVTGLEAVVVVVVVLGEGGAGGESEGEEEDGGGCGELHG